MAKPIIELHNIVKKYGAVTVVDNIDLTIYENEFVTLLGPSGCGKTTTLRMIGGFEYPDSGEIVVNGKIINDERAYVRFMGNAVGAANGQMQTMHEDIAGCSGYEVFEGKDLEEMGKSIASSCLTMLH